MGFRFRKSIKIGPARINLSKSGIGWSIGGKGARFTKKAGGGYRTTVGVPGTGLSYSKDFSVKERSHNSKQQKELESTVHYVPQERRENQQKVGAAMGVFFALLFISVIAWKVFGSLNIFTSDVVFANVIPNEAVWDIKSSIEFIKYPGSCKPGDKVLVEIQAKPDSYYSIVVYDDAGRIKANSLVGTSTNAVGRANWSWNVSMDAVPGIYYIQVSDRFGNQNCIDYCILDQSGNVVGNPPSRETSIKKDNQSFTIEIEDIEHAPTQSQTVYITETGSKYHKATCVHVSSGALATDLSSALAQGYSACQNCY